MHMGYVLLNCDLGSEERVARELGRVPNVRHAHLTFGAYDVIAEVHAGNREDFERTVGGRIRRIPGVSSTMTLNITDPG